MSESLSAHPSVTIVAPEVLFSSERLLDAAQDPVPIQPIADLVDRLDKIVQPPRFMPYGMPATPVVEFVAEENCDPARITHYAYETKEAHENTDLRDEEGRTLLATIENYQPGLSQTDSTVKETLCVDRSYRTFVRREEVQPDGSLVVATAPGGWEDIIAATNWLDGKLPGRSWEELGPEEKAFEEQAAKNMVQLKHTLSLMPEFRQAVVKRLSPSTQNPSEETVDTLVANFWEGNHSAPNDDPNRRDQYDPLAFYSGSQTILLKHTKEAVYVSENGQPGICINETIDIAIDNAAQNSRTELALRTGRHAYRGAAIVYEVRQFDDKDNFIPLQMLSSYTPADAPALQQGINDIQTLLLSPSPAIGDRPVRTEDEEDSYAEPVQEADEATIAALQGHKKYTYPEADNVYEAQEDVAPQHKVPGEHSASHEAQEDVVPQQSGEYDAGYIQSAGRIAKILRRLRIIPSRGKK